MSNTLILVSAVMLAAGLIGGWTNYLISPRTEADRPDLTRSLVAGVVAAFLVPLFLNMISSNLLDLIRGNGKTPGDLSKLYVFAGFCLVAAVSSKAFINTLSDRILQEAREARREATKARGDVASVRAVVEPIVAKETELDSGELATERLQESVHESMSPSDRVLSVLIPRRWTLRSLSGIAKEARVDRDEAVRILEGLERHALVSVRATEQGDRWFLTEEGRKTAEHLPRLEHL